MGLISGSYIDFKVSRVGLDYLRNQVSVGILGTSVVIDLDDPPVALELYDEVVTGLHMVPTKTEVGRCKARSQQVEATLGLAPLDRNAELLRQPAGSARSEAGFIKNRFPMVADQCQVAIVDGLDHKLGWYR